MANVARLQEADIEKIYLCPLFKGIDTSTLAAIIKKPYTKVTECEDDTVVYKTGQKLSQMVLVLTGELGLINTNFRHESSIVEVFDSGELFGSEYVLASDNHLNYDVCALEDSKILTIDYSKLVADKDFVKIIGVISNNLLQFHVAHARALQAHIYHLAQPTTREKLLAYLTDESNKAGSNSFHIKFDRQELADYLAVERSAMCAELSRMQKAGLITYRKNDFTLKKK